MLTDGPHVAPERWYSDVIARRDFPRYKNTCKDAVGGGSETNHCTVPREPGSLQELGDWARTVGALRETVKSLSVLQQSGPAWAQLEFWTGGSFYCSDD